MIYSIEHIARLINAKPVIIHDTEIEHLLLDSRKVYEPASSLFFALSGSRRDGHTFIAGLYKRGVKNFVVSKEIELAVYPGANFLYVPDTLVALQQLVAAHRKQFTLPVIGITGSNGKTMVKEWLYQLLEPDYNIVRSPRSYNSQIGVPLSVWQMNEEHTLAIFEAGISQPGEMERLEKIIQPTIGVLTNIGEAHSEGFSSREEKESEKKVLLKNALAVPKLEIVNSQSKGLYTEIEARQPGNLKQSHSIEIPFTDAAAIENAITCWRVMLLLGYENDIIKKRMKLLHPVNMRLELKNGINNCTIINDSYSADISSLEIALNFLDQQTAKPVKTVILSDFLQSAINNEKLYKLVIESLKKHKISRLIGIGNKISEALQYLGSPSGIDFTVQLFSSTEEFLQQLLSSQFRDEAILIKGARIFSFERIVQLLEQKVHQTVLEINLNAMVHNLKEYQQKLKPETKVMAMVKAFAYGSGGAEIAGVLQYYNIDYLGVAYADEGVDLRKAGITLPVMVMNPEENAFETIVENNLEPELYSFGLMEAFDEFLRKEGLVQYPVHLEMETGMNRLGFSIDDMEKLGNTITSTSSFKVKSVFSHFSASEEAAQDAFTKEQFTKFSVAAGKLQSLLKYNFLKHISNSAAVIRHPDMQLDMVRLGIGLYGIDIAASGELKLETVTTLKSTIAQIKKVQAGETVSYNRKGTLNKESLIATVRIGYADGYPRRLGNGVGKVFVKGKLAPVVGTVCMDMFMIDVTEVPGAQAGDDVIIFGEYLPVQELAKWAGTIPYEIMTGISQRVKRVYFEE